MNCMDGCIPPECCKNFDGVFDNAKIGASPYNSKKSMLNFVMKPFPKHIFNHISFKNVSNSKLNLILELFFEKKHNFDSLFLKIE